MTAAAMTTAGISILDIPSAAGAGWAVGWAPTADAIPEATDCRSGTTSDEPEDDPSPPDGATAMEEDPPPPDGAFMGEGAVGGIAPGAGVDVAGAAGAEDRPDDDFFLFLPKTCSTFLATLETAFLILLKKLFPRFPKSPSPSFEISRSEIASARSLRMISLELVFPRVGIRYSPRN